MQVTAAMLRALGASNADTWASVLAPVCQRYAITTRVRLAAFLANVLHETSGFLALVENLNYSPDGLLRTWPTHFTSADAYRLGRTDDHAADQKGIADLAYGGRLGNGPVGSGDGWLYRGRGLIQLTGKANYERFAKTTGLALGDLPALLQLPAGAAESAGLYWSATRCNDPADRGDIAEVRRLVQGGTGGLEDVRRRYEAALAALPVEDAPAPAAAEPGQPAPPPAPIPPPAPKRGLGALLSLFRKAA